jgi:hypothetical protein
MAEPTRGSGTSISAIQVRWVELAGDQTGGAPIDSYMLEWDAGAGAGTAMQPLVGGPAPADYSLATEYTTPPGAVQAGGSYRFRISAHNAHGWGPAAPT